MTDDVLLEKIGGLIDSKLKPIKKDLKSLKRTLDVAINTFDRHDVKTSKRLERIEDHLDLPPIK